jgi:hypothetical protein
MRLTTLMVSILVTGEPYMMTKQHFRALAQALAKRRPDDSMSTEYLNWEHTCQAIGRVCLQFNPHFSWPTFWSACQE